MDFDILIVGSGPGGTAAALGATNQELSVGVLDVGNDASKVLWPETFESALRKPELWRDQFLGKNNEYLQGLINRTPLAKLRAPFQSFVNKDSDLTPVEGHGFNALVSHALGGLANIWGAQMLRYDTDDLAQFTFPVNSLSKHYDIIEREMSISGLNDDLTKFYGSDQQLQSPLKLNPNTEDLLKRYRKRRTSLNHSGFYIGHPRTAILTTDKDNRKATTYNGLEFFKPRPSAIYTPALTLQHLIENGKVTYIPKHLALSFQEDCEGVKIEVRDLKTDQVITITARKLILAAGALGSARLVLASRNDTETRLPLLDNPLSYIPVINPFRLGKTGDAKTSYLQLNLCYQPENQPLTMGSFYAINGLFHSDFIRDLPFTMSDSIRLLPYIVPSLLVLHLWHPNKSNINSNWVQLDQNGVLHAHWNESTNKEVEHKIIRHLARLGFLTLQRMVEYPMPGNSFHRCGTLPMKRQPKAYETDSDGRLGASKNIYVADASVFPNLQAKNLSLTLMANAHRVANHVASSL